MPTWPASGNTDWNTKMLAYLAIEHNTDGTHKAAAGEAALPDDDAFGSWTNQDSAAGTLVKDEVYQVGSDGSIIVYYNSTSPNQLTVGYTDSSNPPTTDRCAFAAVSVGGNFTGSFTMPVRKDDYWKATGFVTTIYWLPIGTGTCVKQ